MSDLLSKGLAMVRDPLVTMLVVFAAGGVLVHFSFRRHPLGRAMVRVIFLIILTIVLLHGGIVPFQPLTLTGVPLEDAVHAALKIVWWMWTAWFVVGLLRAFVVTEQRPREGKLIQDLLAGLVYLSAILAIIAYVFNLPIKGLLATSGVIAIVLGLALQSTLSDLFSGIVLNFSRPYRPGDWISIEGGTDGRVIEINWRATLVLTAKRDLAIVPNSTIAKAKIVNASSPSGIHGVTVTVQLDAKSPPAAGVEILQQAILNTQLILATPAPLAVVKTISGDTIDFEISFFVEELAHSSRAQNELFDWISRHLGAAGISLASTQSQPYWQSLPPTPGSDKTAAERALDLVEIFAGLTEQERKSLSVKTKSKHHEAGEVLVAVGDIPRSLFVIGAGVVSITRAVSEGEIELARMGPGDHFGEIGMLTGAAAEVTIKALVPVTTYELAKEDLRPLLEARPDVSQELCRALARRQQAGQLIASPAIDATLPANRVSAWFSDRLHRLFDLAQAG